MALRPAPDGSPHAELKSNASNQALDWTTGCYFFVGGLNSIIWGMKWYNAIATGLPFDAKFCLWAPNNDVALATKVVSITATGEYTIEWDDVDKVVVTGALLAAQNCANFPAAWLGLYGVSVYAGGGRTSFRSSSGTVLDWYFDHSHNSALDYYYGAGDTKPKTIHGSHLFISPIVWGNEDSGSPTRDLVDTVGGAITDTLELGHNRTPELGPSIALVPPYKPG